LGEDTSQTKPVPATMTRLRDPQYRELYSNSNLVALSPFDITITFQKVGEAIPGQHSVYDLVSITMSPQQFKGLLRVAGETLAAYENVFGALTISDKDVARTKTAAQIEALLHRNRDTVRPAPAEPQPLPQFPRERRVKPQISN